MFEITLNDGKYTIHNAVMDAGRYLKYNNANANDAIVPVYDDGFGTNNGPYILWTVESPSAHATAMQALKDAQAATAATAAYNLGNYNSLNGLSTVAALETALSSYVQGDFVSPTTIESVEEKYQGNKPNSANIAETVYSNSIHISEPGLYKFSMQAFYRAASNSVTQALHTAGIDFPPVVLFFGSAETQIKSLYDETGQASPTIASGGQADAVYNGTYYANGKDAAKVMFQDGKYHNDVWLYISEAGTYSYGVKYQGWAGSDNMQWFIYSPESVTITSYGDAAENSDYTALANAITAYDGATWGFETGEYAPYNNVSALENIAAAKAINSNETNSKLLVESLTSAIALSTANIGDVECVYNGNFSSDLTGWTRTSNWGEKREDVPTSGTGYYIQPGSLQYGNAGVYTMPLKGNTIYRLQYKYGAWDQEVTPIVSVLCGDNGMAAMSFASTSTNYKTSMNTVDMLFVTGTAGNYVLEIAGNKNLVITDVSITKAANPYLVFNESDDALPSFADGTYPSVHLTRTLSSSYWNTFSVPFNAAIPEGWTVKEFESAADNTINFKSASTIVAGKPYLVKPTVNDVNHVFNGVAVVNTEGVTVGEGDYKFAAQICNKPLATDGTIAYLSTDGTIKKLESGGIKGLRAYFIIPMSSTPTPARIAFVDGDDTGIEDMRIQNDKDDKIYDLNGRRVVTPKKGIYVVNGNKIIK